MKKLAMLCLALTLGAGTTMAAKPAAEKKTVTTVFATDIHCDHCAQKIMNNIPSLGKGVKDVEVDVAAKEVSVTYDAAKNCDENIIRGLASLKVKAQPKKATAE
ncbi:MAG: heavy-metal-associated domain-containing protein [Alistipes sp.]|nr:heavy-metal-associated domain-containing protein [Alistipes sp.]MDE7077956.1 heavy-metal-associated domain-containing protein [Alistipes sp.]